MNDQNNDKSLKEKELERIREIDATIQRMGANYINYRVAKETRKYYAGKERPDSDGSQ